MRRLLSSEGRAQKRNSWDLQSLLKLLGMPWQGWWAAPEVQACDVPNQRGQGHGPCCHPNAPPALQPPHPLAQEKQLPFCSCLMKQNKLVLAISGDATENPSVLFSSASVLPILKTPIAMNGAYEVGKTFILIIFE